MVVLVVPVFVSVFVFVLVAVLAGLVVMVFVAFVMMVMMIFVYHGIPIFLDAKLRYPACNRVAIFPGNAYLAGTKTDNYA